MLLSAVAFTTSSVNFVAFSLLEVRITIARSAAVPSVDVRTGAKRRNHLIVRQQAIRPEPFNRQRRQVCGSSRAGYRAVEIAGNPELEATGASLVGGTRCVNNERGVYGREAITGRVARSDTEQGVAERSERRR
jgi:hypothetical protein